MHLLDLFHRVLACGWIFDRKANGVHALVLQRIVCINKGFSLFVMSVMSSGLQRCSSTYVSTVTEIFQHSYGSNRWVGWDQSRCGFVVWTNAQRNRVLIDHENHFESIFTWQQSMRRTTRGQNVRIPKRRSGNLETDEDPVIAVCCSVGCICYVIDSLTLTDRHQQSSMPFAWNDQSPPSQTHLEILEQMQVH